jgi:hypothetical protein
MKKLAIVCAACMVLGIILSSCNREVCPAYSNADTVQTEEAA